MGVEYTENHEKSEMIPYPLPSTGGEGIVEVPTRLGFGSLTRIRAAALRTEVNPVTGEEKQVGSLAEFAQEVLLANLLDPRTTHNLVREGRKIEMTEGWILHGGLDEDDAAILAALMTQRYFEQQARRVAGSADPEVESPTSPKRRGSSGRSGRLPSESPRT